MYHFKYHDGSTVAYKRMNKLETQLQISRFPQRLRQFWEVVPRDIVIKSTEEIARKISGSSVQKDYCKRFMPIEYSFYRMIRRQSMMDKLDPIKYPELYEAVSFIANFLSVYDFVSNAAKKKLRGRLIASWDISDSSAGVGPLAFEVSTAMHFTMRGWCLQFTDLENLSSSRKFDFFAHKTNKFIEIECKYVSYNTGMPVHMDKALRLSDEIGDNAKLFRHEGCKIVLVSDQEGWTFSENQKQELVDTILNPKLNKLGRDVKLLYVEHFPDLIPSRDIGRDEEILREYVRKKTKYPVGYVLIVEKRSGQSSVILGMMTTKKVNIIDRLRKKILEDTGKASQFSHRIPGVLFIQLAGISVKGIRRLASPAGKNVHHSLEALVSEVFGKRPNLASITFRGMGAELIQERKEGLILLTRSLQDRGPILQYSNPAHPLNDFLSSELKS